MASYQAEREQFIARMTQEGLPLDVTRLLLREATGINRRAELACSSEAADRDRVPCPAMPIINNKGEKRNGIGPCLCDAECSVCHKGYPQVLPHSGDASCSHCGSDWVPIHHPITRITLQDFNAELRIRCRLPEGWTFTTEGDPRGYTLRVIPPSYAERNQGRDRFNLDAIGVPPGPSRIRW